MLAGRLIARMEQTPVQFRRSDDTPEIIRDRVATYYSTSKPVTDFYKTLGKVRDIIANGTADEIYNQTVDALRPNVISVIGPPCIGKTTLAKKLAQHTHFIYINATTFFAKNNAVSCEEKVKCIGEFCFSSGNKNFVLDGFPQTKTQAKIFEDVYSVPVSILHINATKDEVYDRIDNVCGTNYEKGD